MNRHEVSLILLLVFRPSGILGSTQGMEKV